jgi:hypothetical protein
VPSARRATRRRRAVARSAGPVRRSASSSSSSLSMSTTMVLANTRSAVHATTLKAMTYKRKANEKAITRSKTWYLVVIGQRRHGEIEPLQAVLRRRDRRHRHDGVVRAHRRRRSRIRHRGAQTTLRRAARRRRRRRESGHDALLRRRVPAATPARNETSQHQFAISGSKGGD